MAIDSTSNIPNEQLLAMSMLSNGQVTNDSDSTDSTSSDEKDLAFQMVMKNLLEESKKSKENQNSQVSNNKANSNDTNDGTDSSNISKNTQTYMAGQKLEDIPMVLNNNSINFNRSSIASNENTENIYSAVDSAARKYGVDANLILAVIKQESDFDQYSTSEAGAAGLMQIMPSNFSSLGITDAYNTEQNINGGTKLLKEYLDKYNGSTEMALMAYNGGPGTIQKRGVSSPSDLYKMPEETQNYVPKVMGYYRNGV